MHQTKCNTLSPSNFPLSKWMPCCAGILTAVYIVSIYSDEGVGQDTLSDAGEPNGGFALVINGHSLVWALSPKFEQLFLEVASQCK